MASIPFRTVQDTGDVVLFGAGSPQRLPALLSAAGAQRVLVVTSPRWSGLAQTLAGALGPRHAGTFTEVAAQVPESVARAVVETARGREADWALAVGGGAAVGAAKIVALEVEHVRVAAIPTTYAGSERTNIWGRSVDGHKRSGRDDRVRPVVVAYDPALQASLPRNLGLHSLLNGLAHSVEALYAVACTPAARGAAQRSLAPVWQALAGLGAEPADAASRQLALFGAWQASEALGGASMGLHHKLAHVLGGSFGLAHAATHATLLPHTLGFNLPAAPALRGALQREWQTHTPAAALFDRMRSLGLPTALADLGLAPEQLDRAASLALQRSYPNPRPVTRDDLVRLLERACHGRRPLA